MTTLYISGPIAGRPREEAEAEFAAAAERLTAAGYHGKGY